MHDKRKSKVSTGILLHFSLFLHWHFSQFGPDPRMQGFLLIVDIGFWKCFIHLGRNTSYLLAAEEPKAVMFEMFDSSWFMRKNIFTGGESSNCKSEDTGRLVAKAIQNDPCWLRNCRSWCPFILSLPNLNNTALYHTKYSQTNTIRHKVDVFEISGQKDFSEMQGHTHVHTQEHMISTYIQREKGPCIYAEWTWMLFS